MSDPVRRVLAGGEGAGAGAFSRRVLLKGGAVVAASFGAGILPGFARRALAAVDEGPGRRKVLASLFLRGAMDGLNVLSPHGDPRFAQMRPTLALPSPGEERKTDDGPGALLDLGVPGFGLHPSLEPLLPLWREGTLAFVHAVGSPDASRSHFDAQDFLELGTPGVKGTPDGWLARSLAETRNPSLVEAVAVSQRLPRSLQGARGALAFSSLDQLRLHALAGAPAGKKGRIEAQAAFDAMYGLHSDEPVAVSGKEAFAAVQLLERKLEGGVAGPAPEYPKGPLSQPLRQLTLGGDLGGQPGLAAFF